MGIRIHKIMGYGFDDLALAENGWELNDPRINNSALDKLYDEETQISNYVDWIQETYLTGEPKIEHERPVDITDTDLLHIRNLDKKAQKSILKEYAGRYMVVRPDCDDRGWTAGTIVFTPLWMDDWQRGDDAIDYAEHQQAVIDSGRFINGQVQNLTYGQFPYSASYFNLKTKKPIMGSSYSDAQLFAGRGDMDIADVLVKKDGFDNFADAQKNIAPTVPLTIKHFTDWLGVFNNPETYLHLKPMVVTYWS